jgi:hypothetical protein
VRHALRLPLPPEAVHEYVQALIRAGLVRAFVGDFVDDQDSNSQIMITDAGIAYLEASDP